MTASLGASATLSVMARSLTPAIAYLGTLLETTLMLL